MLQTHIISSAKHHFRPTKSEANGIEHGELETNTTCPSYIFLLLKLVHIHWWLPYSSPAKKESQTLYGSGRFHAIIIMCQAWTDPQKLFPLGFNSLYTFNKELINKRLKLKDFIPIDSVISSVSPTCLYVASCFSA